MKLIKSLPLLVFVLAIGTGGLAQEEQAATGTGTSTWFPKQSIFQPLMMDPLEAQSGGSIVRMANAGSSFNQDLYVPFSIGFSKGIWQRTSSTGTRHQIRAELVNFTQFEWLRNGAERNLINSDYKVGFQYQLGSGSWQWRFRWYHLSSHVGDDYMVRRGISNFETYKPAANNYEQLDVAVSRWMGPFRAYVLLGAIARLNSPREKFMYQFGGQWEHHFNNGDSPLKLIASADVKGWEYLDYRPGVKAGFGIGYGPGHETYAAIMIEAYAGHLPYGLFEKEPLVLSNPKPPYPESEWGGQVRWFGLGLYVNPVF